MVNTVFTGVVVAGFVIQYGNYDAARWWPLVLAVVLIVVGATEVYYRQEYADLMRSRSGGSWYGKPGWHKFSGIAAILMGIVIIVFSILARIQNQP
jgi:uncharacterized membrane protein